MQKLANVSTRLLSAMAVNQKRSQTKPTKPSSLSTDKSKQACNHFSWGLNTAMLSLSLSLSPSLSLSLSLSIDADSLLVQRAYSRQRGVYAIFVMQAFFVAAAESRA